MTPFVLLFTLCTISHYAPYLTDCQPLMINHKSKKACEVRKRKVMAKAPIWSDNPAHPFFEKRTAAPIREPICMPNPHMNHIEKHIKGQRYEDNRPEELQPPFDNTWKFKGFKTPGKYDKFLKGIKE